MHKKLFIPGPVEVLPEVLEKMATPMIGHRTKAASELQKSISEKAQSLFYTKETILLSTTSGTGLMEAAAKSCTRKKAAVFSIGAFGDRWYETFTTNGIDADLYEVEWGTPTLPDHLDKALSSGKYDLVTLTHNETSTGVMLPMEEISQVIQKYPNVIYCLDTVSSMGGAKIEVDQWGIDICITSTQKCLGLPPGLAIASMSKKAFEATKEVKNRGFYLDLQQLYKYVEKNYQYPSTPALSLMYALDYQLDRIMEEGLENRFQRHLVMAKYVRNWANTHFELLPEDKYASNTVTTIKNTKNIDISELNKRLGEKGFTISDGYGKMKGITFRVAHMADCTLPEIHEVIAAIDEVLGLPK